jgi:UDP-N-acetylmuramyl pentapeptide phosphotransferase/UDP-N-acetylglucosamine-1-phosphate transferase
MWNWQPARVFLGDVGSIPLGFATGWLLLRLAIHHAWAAALLLPAFFLADATITLGHRIWRREKIWQAHRTHFYQKAVQSGFSHARVVRLVIGADLCLFLAAWHSFTAPSSALSTGVIIVGFLLFILGRGNIQGAAVK